MRNYKSYIKKPISFKLDFLRSTIVKFLLKFCFIIILLLTPFMFAKAQFPCSGKGPQVCDYAHPGDESHDPNNKATNGNFTQGNAWFGSQYIHTNEQNGLNGPAEYGVSDDPSYLDRKMAANNHSTTWDGKMMVGVGNGREPLSGTNLYFWRQTISVVTNTNYTFSYWLCLPVNVGLTFASIQVQINGIDAGEPQVVPRDTGIWIQKVVSWNSGNDTSATINMIDLNQNSPSNWGIDDISFSESGASYFIKAMLEGFYNVSFNKNNIQDVVTVYLRSDSPPYSIVDSCKSSLDNNGAGTFGFPNVVGGNSYYIVIKHRNSIETWSSDAITFSSGKGFNFDFTIDAAQALGNNLVLKEKVWCIYSGDVNQDGIIDATDVSLIENDANNSLTKYPSRDFKGDFSSRSIIFKPELGYAATDLNGDGIVDRIDLSICENNALNFVMAVTNPQTAKVKREAKNYKTRDGDSKRKDKKDEILPDKK